VRRALLFTGKVGCIQLFVQPCQASNNAVGTEAVSSPCPMRFHRTVRLVYSTRFSIAFWLVSCLSPEKWLLMSAILDLDFSIQGAQQQSNPG
jgi:hypothetical protein